MAGILDSIRDKIKEKGDKLLGEVQPFKAIGENAEAFKKAAKPQDPQEAYKAQEKWLNRNNPYYRVDDTVKQVK